MYFRRWLWVQPLEADPDRPVLSCVYARETGVRGDKGGENSITLCSGLWRGLSTNTTFSCNRAGSSAVLTAGGSGHAPSPAGGLAVFRARLRCGFPAGPLISPAPLRDPASQPQSSFIVCMPHSSIPRAFTTPPRVPFLSPASGYPHSLPDHLQIGV